MVLVQQLFACCNAGHFCPFSFFFSFFLTSTANDLAFNGMKRWKKGQDQNEHDDRICASAVWTIYPDTVPVSFDCMPPSTFLKTWILVKTHLRTRRGLENWGSALIRTWKSDCIKASSALDITSNHRRKLQPTEKIHHQETVNKIIYQCYFRLQA